MPETPVDHDGDFLAREGDVDGAPWCSRHLDVETVAVPGRVEGAAQEEFWGCVVVALSNHLPPNCLGEGTRPSPGTHTMDYVRRSGFEDAKLDQIASDLLGHANRNCIPDLSELGKVPSPVALTRVSRPPATPGRAMTNELVPVGERL